MKIFKTLKENPIIILWFTMIGMSVVGILRDFYLHQPMNMFLEILGIVLLISVGKKFGVFKE